MKNWMLGICLCCALVLLNACEEPVYQPKPRGYFRIALPEQNYIPLQSPCPYTFQMYKGVQVKSAQNYVDYPCSINLLYPEFHATIYLTYLPIQNNYEILLDDATQMAYKHSVKASSISEQVYLNKEANVFATTYTLEGATATPYQFFVTDEKKHFIMATLYFDFQPNYDSLAPVVGFLKRDMDQIIETIRWK